MRDIDRASRLTKTLEAIGSNTCNSFAAEWPAGVFMESYYKNQERMAVAECLLVKTITMGTRDTPRGPKFSISGRYTNIHAIMALRLVISDYLCLKMQIVLFEFPDLAKAK